MADQLYDVEAVAGQIGNVLAALKVPGTDSTGITQTGDVISQIGQTAPSPRPGANVQPGSAAPMSGTLADGSYDGYSISQEYGGQGGHPGLDIGVPVGTKLIAPISGTVTNAGEAGGYGNMVEITGDDGTVVRYGHLSGIGVQSGQTVSPGTMIGLSGGQAGAPGAGNSTGPHLHFEVHRGGPTVDPSSFLAGGWQILGS